MKNWGKWTQTPSYWIFLGILFLSSTVFLWKKKSFNNTAEDRSDDDNENPRKMKGIDTLYYDDSIYVIHFKIDSVFKDEPDNTNSEHEDSKSRY